MYVRDTRDKDDSLIYLSCIKFRKIKFLTA